MRTPREALLDFLNDRRGQLRAVPVKNRRGLWDVALSVDGPYLRESDAETTARLINGWIERLATQPPKEDS